MMIQSHTALPTLVLLLPIPSFVLFFLTGDFIEFFRNRMALLKQRKQENAQVIGT
jgi:hypothetical protein